MMKTVRHLTPILLLLVGSLFATSCSVPPVREAPRVKTFTAPWSSWYFSGSHSGYVQGQKAAFLPDGDVIIVSHERRSFRIDRFDSELRAVDTLTIPRDRDDEYVRLFVGEDATHVVTLAEEKDSLAIRHRRIPHDSFVPTAQTTVHRIFDDLDGWIPVRMAFSPDSNYVLLWSFG